jgi:REP element-mobilizing transposase RayT
MEELPKRRRPASGVVETENGPTIVFDTVCVFGRIGWLANDEVHTLLVNVWQEAKAWLVGRYIIMPDHRHYFATPGMTPVPFENWVRYWKSQFTKRYKRDHGGEQRPAGWQSNDWDTRMRSEQAYEEKWEYVRMNPERRGLVALAEKWPYQGELNEIRWE